MKIQHFDAEIVKWNLNSQRAIEENRAIGAVVGSILVMSVAAPGTGEFRYMVTKVYPDGSVDAKLQSSTVRELTISDVK